MYRLVAPILLLLSLPLFGQQTDPVFVINNPDGHFGTIIKILVTKDNNTAITIGKDKSICFWDIQQAKLKKKLWLDIGENENGRLLDADLDLDNSLMAVARLNAAGEYVVSLLDIDEYKLLGTYIGFSNGLRFVRFDPNGKFIITGAAQEYFFQQSEPLKLWKIPATSQKKFLISEPSASIESNPMHDIAFYDHGKKISSIAYTGKNSDIEIVYDKNAIPEYTLQKISNSGLTSGHVRYLKDQDKLVYAKHSGIVQLIDNKGQKAIIYEPTGDTTLSDMYLNKAGKTAYLEVHRPEVDQYFSAIMRLGDKVEISLYPYNFSYIAFTSDSTFLGTDIQGLKHINFVSREEVSFTSRFVQPPSDPIAFGPGKIIAFDSLNRSFDFENHTLDGVEDFDGFSFNKTSYKGTKIEIAPGDEQLLFNGKKRFLFFNSNLIASSFLNDGHFLVNYNRYRDYQTSLILYDVSDHNSVSPMKEFTGSFRGVTGIAPAPDVGSGLFAIKDFNGMLSLYNSENPKQREVLKIDEGWGKVFKKVWISYSKKKKEWVINPLKNYQGLFVKNDVIIRVNDFVIDPSKDLYTYLESLDASKPVLVEVKRKEQVFTEELELNTIMAIPPLLSFYAQDKEWICWSPEGYYASSVAGEQLGGWVINNGINELAEYHPIYDFKKEYYKPELIKLIAKNEAYERAVEVYNRTASVPLSANKNVAENLPPSIKWVTPGSMDTTYQQNAIILTAEIASSTDISNAKVLLNGRTILRRDQMKISEQPDNKYEVRFEMELLNPQNTVNIFVENQNGSTISEERIIRSQRIKKGLERYKPNLYILNIGVSKHSNPDYSLTYADKDANAIAEVYKSQQGKLFKNVFDRTLTNESATRSNILEAFYWLEKNATQKDVVLIFIASHGINEKDKFYILPYDGDPDRIRITGVDWLDFSDVLGNLPSKVLVFIDACHSGKLGTNLLANRGRTDLVEAIRALATEENGVVIMAASTGKEYSYESQEWGHGAFTLALLNGLRDGEADLNQDGIINIREIDYLVAERVKALTNGKQHPTTQKPSVVAEFPLLLLDRNNENRN